ncbi:MAG: polysaccharide biosynthesis tyrosine autokinase [Anaerolineae bacterium]|nr:polysaccharide biosynthesis tyrosine autokinase [Anaerolineae bacterium]
MELRQYIAPLLKWWWLLLTAQLVAAGAGYIATRDQPAIYQTSVTLAVGRILDNPNPSGGEIGLGQQLVNAYAETARSRSVRNATMVALGMPWLPRYTVRSIPSTLTLEITVLDVSPERAQAVANALANELIRRSPAATDKEDQQRQAFINQQLNELEASIDETRQDIDRIKKDLEKMTSARQIADAQIQIAALDSKLRALQANYASMLANTRRGAINTLTLVDPAPLPSIPIGPDRISPILMAAAIGLILAVGGAYLLEYLDDTVKSPDDVQLALSLNTLGAIPEQNRVSPENMVRVGSHSPTTEAYRILRTNLEFAVADRSLRRILITSPSPTEGKSITTANLGAALAQIGRKVILVDADLRRPQLHKVFGLDNTVGLTGALSHENYTLDGALVETNIPGLSVLPSGPSTLNPGNWLESARMRRLLDSLQEQADIILVDTPPVTLLADALVLSSLADGVLLVLESGKTRRNVAKRALEALSRVNAKIIGVVLNRVPVDDSRYYYA